MHIRFIVFYCIRLNLTYPHDLLLAPKRVLAAFNVMMYLNLV